MNVTVFYVMIPCGLVKNTYFSEEYIISYSTLNMGQYFSLQCRQIFSQTTRRHIEEESNIQYLRCFVDNSIWCRCFIIIIVCFGG